MSLDVELALRDLLGMNEKEFNSYFEVHEKDDNITIEMRKDSKGRAVWLERGTWLGVNNYAKDMGGSWDKNRAVWTIPLAHVKTEKPKAPIPLEQPTPKQEICLPETISDEDESAYLRATYEKLGPITPVFRAPNGTVIDGKHRLEVDRGWFSIVLRNLNDPVKVAMARLIVNVVRRKVPASEKTELLGEIAKLTGWSPKEIADSLGMSYRWVMQYLPDEYKERAGLGGPKQWEKVDKCQVARRATPSTGFEFDQIVSAIQLAPEEIQPRLKEVVTKQRFTPEETAELVDVIKDTPKEKWPEVLLQPRTSVMKWKAEQKRESSKRVLRKEVDTGFEWECPECHRRYQLIHVNQSDGKVKHRFEVKG